MGKLFAWLLIFAVELPASVLIFIAAKVLLAFLFTAPSKDVVIQGPAEPPQLAFACCDQGTPALESLFAKTAIVPDLKGLHASLAVAISDFSPERAGTVRRLNQAGIPLFAWIELSAQQGYYLNEDSAAAASARFDEFQKWTADYGLRWQSVGLDFEPNFKLFAGFEGHRWSLAWFLLKRSVDGAPNRRAFAAYSALVRRIQSAGYQVQIFQMPYVVDEREAGSTLIDRLLGTVDVRGNLDVPMLYSSSFPAAGSAMIWRLGRGAQAISVGSTFAPGDGSGGALDWNEFRSDLIVAGNNARVVGVYNLEGCVNQGFLPRLEDFDWRQSVTIPARAARTVTLLGAAAESSLWAVSHLIYFAAVIMIADVAFVFLWRARKRTDLL